MKSMHLNRGVRLAVFAWAVVVIILGLSGCGGGGGSTATPDAMGAAQAPAELAVPVDVVLSGSIGYMPTVGATVRARNLTGDTLGSATTGPNGAYSMSFVAAGDQPLRLEAEFNGLGGALRLSTLWLPGDSPTGVNLTPLSTLVDLLAKDSPANRNAILAEMERIGVASSSWNALNPDTVNALEFNALRNRADHNAVLSALAEDLRDYDLAPENMAWFRNAHGGIRNIRVGRDGRGIVALTGIGAASGVFIDSSRLAAELVVERLSGAVTVQLEDSGWQVYYDARNHANAGADEFELWVAERASGKGRRVNVPVNIVVGRVLAETTVDGRGGELASEDGLSGVTIPAGLLRQPTPVRLLEGAFQGSRNLVVVAQTSDSVLLDVVMHQLPRSEAPITARSSLTARAASSEPGNFCEPGAMAKQWQSYQGYLSDSSVSNYRVESATGTLKRGFNYPPYVTERIVKLESIDDAAVLCGAVGRAVDPAYWKNREPVIFVHGYEVLGDLGGGSETWAVFPELIGALSSSNGARFVPFEFRWRTNARFQTVAKDLADAITLIHTVTGKKVHLVGHSMGGALIRTLMQGVGSELVHLIYTQPLTRIDSKLVASVTTLGSPHSGLSPEPATMHGVAFPQGYHFAAESIFCKQLSCFQLGDPTLFLDRNVGILGGSIRWDYDHQVSSRPGFIASQLHLPSSPWPTDIPLAVGIGLRTVTSSRATSIFDGDGLISFAGQRFRVGDALSSAPLDPVERIIGGGSITQFPTSPDQINRANGYAHTSNFAGLVPAAKQANISRSECTPERVAECTHGSFLIVRDLLNAHAGQATANLGSIATRRPEHLAAYTFGDKVHLSWGAVALADAYEVHVSRTSGFTPDGQNVEVYLVPDSNLRLDRLDGGARFFRVVAKNASGKSLPSEEASFEILPGVVSGIVRDAKSGAAVTNAVVSMDIAKNTLSTVVNEGGYYVIRVPTSVTFATIRVEAEGYLPASIQVASKDFASNKFLLRDVSLTTSGPSIVTVDDGTQLYHLGNDRFEGTINSGFQTTAIGTEVALSFRVTAEQRSRYKTAVLRAQAKGVQASIVRSYFFINDKSIDYLRNSPSNGSFGPVELPFSLAEAGVVEGNNTLKLTTKYHFNEFNPSADNYDDFEITNIYLELRP